MTRLTDSNTPAGDQMRGVQDALATGSHYLIGDLQRAFEALDVARTPQTYGSAMGGLLDTFSALEKYVTRIELAARRLQMRDALAVIDDTYGERAAA